MLTIPLPAYARRAHRPTLQVPSSESSLSAALGASRASDCTASSSTTATTLALANGAQRTSAATSLAQSPAGPPSHAPVRRPSPLKFAIFDDSADPEDSSPETPVPSANLSPPPTVKRLSPVSQAQEGKENVAGPIRPAGRRWSAITRIREDKRRLKSLSPVKDASPLKEGTLHASRLRSKHLY